MLGSYSQEKPLTMADFVNLYKKIDAAEEYIKISKNAELNEYQSRCATICTASVMFKPQQIEDKTHYDAHVNYLQCLNEKIEAHKRNG